MCLALLFCSAAARLQHFAGKTTANVASTLSFQNGGGNPSATATASASGASRRCMCESKTPLESTYILIAQPKRRALCLDDDRFSYRKLSGKTPCPFANVVHCFVFCNEITYHDLTLLSFMWMSFQGRIVLL